MIEAVTPGCRSALGPLTLAVELAREQTACEGAPGRQRQPFGAAERDQLSLDVTACEAVVQVDVVEAQALQARVHAVQDVVT